MSMEKIVIDGDFPGLNQIINTAKTHFGAYSQMKKEHTERVQWACKELSPDFEPDRVFLNITYFVPNWRKDQDNIAVAKKFILDGMVEEGIIEDDSHQYIAGWKERFKKDKENPRIEVVVEEVEQGS